MRRRTGAGRDTIRKAVAAAEPPSYSQRPKRPSKFGPPRAEIEWLLAAEPTLSSVRVLEKIQLDGYRGGQTNLAELLRELRPRYLPPRRFQRTACREDELCQFDVTELRREIPVSWRRTRRGWIVTAKLPTRAPSPARFPPQPLTGAAISVAG